MKLRRIAEAKLPTPFGEFLMVGLKKLPQGKIMLPSFLVTFLAQNPFYPVFILNV